MAVNTLPRDFDLARIIDDYERRIAFLERQIRNTAYLTPDFVGGQGARVTRNAVQLITHASFNTVSFNAEVFDPTGMHSNVTNPERITANVAGWYTIGANIEMAQAADYTRIILTFRHNSSTRIAFSSSPGLPSNVDQRYALNTTYYFAAGEWVDFQIHQTNSGSASRNVNVVGDYSPQFWAVRIGG